MFFFYSSSNFLVSVKPTNNPIPAIKNIKAGYKESLSISVYVDKIEASKIPLPIPISNKAIFKINTFQNGAAFLFSFLEKKILASAHFYINAKSSLFLVVKNR